MPIEINWAMALRTALNNPPDDGEEQIVKEARRLKDEHQTEFLKQFHRHEMLEAQAEDRGSQNEGSAQAQEEKAEGSWDGPGLGGSQGLAGGDEEKRESSPHDPLNRRRTGSSS